jgi:hypothetical protein
MRSTVAQAPRASVPAESLSRWRRGRRVLRRFTRRRPALIGAVIIVVFVITALFAP